MESKLRAATEMAGRLPEKWHASSMRLNSLTITNFRAIRDFSVEDLGDVVVVAGPNGCGKSAILHALRLLKSTYGGYRDNEFRQWFTEFQINLDPMSEDFARLVRDQSAPLVIIATATVADRERTYLTEKGKVLLEAQAWQEIAPKAVNWSSRQRAHVTPDVEQYRARVDERTDDLYRALMADLDKEEHGLELRIGLDGRLRTSPSPAVQLLFSVYDPENLGIVEYHADTRQYDRASMGSLNVNFANVLDRRSQQALYQTQQKYQNLRADLLTSYLSGLVRAHAGADQDEAQSLLDTLKELFRSFFPGKEFVGAVPRWDGTVEFPVRLADGSTHDIADLSAGEKEIVFGYLRLHGLNPRDSILLFDEPELHLNPRLMTGLTAFYSRHLGAPRGNQLWMTTHSDTLLREAIGKPGYSVYHMRSASVDDENQAVPVTEDDALERALIDIVGDLAAYQPGKPVVILEGGGEDEFDATVVARLFPETAAAVNIVSGGSKRRVKELCQTLSQLRADAELGIDVYGIVDRDGETEDSEDAGQVYRWDRYHIENYLLDDTYLYEVVAALGTSRLRDSAEVGTALRDCAEALLPRLVAHRLRERVNRKVVDCVDLSGAPDAEPAATLREALERSFARLEAVRTDLTLATLESEEADVTRSLASDLADDAWRTTFAGREILKRFVHEHVEGVNYIAFRNLVLERMALARFEPAGMRAVLERIAASSAG